MQIQLVKETPLKRGKWLSLLVDWWSGGQVPPLGYTITETNRMELSTARSQTYINLCITYMMNTFMLRKFAPAKM